MTLSIVNAPAVAASSQAKPKENVTDGSVTSYWASGSNATHVDEWLTFDTGAVQLIGQVRLRSRNSGALFPEDLEILRSDDNVTFGAPVATFTGLPATVATWHDLAFTPAMGRYVRVNMTKLRLASGNFKAHIAEAEVFTAAFQAGDVTLAWTAPGDDNNVGKATSYDLRWSVNPITDMNFILANSVSTDPPKTAGEI